MNRVISTLRRAFSHPTGRPSGGRRARPAVEPLESRDVPTLVFPPKFGPETVTHRGMVLSNTPVYFLFWGSYWQNEGRSLANAIQFSGGRIMASPYLSGLTQYGSDGHARLVNSVFEPNGAPQNFTHDDLFYEVKETILDPNVADFPRPSSLGPTPLYMVFTPPGITSDSPTARGYHTSDWFIDPSYNVQVFPFAWVGGPNNPYLSYGQVVDYYTTVLSHELVESMSDPFPGAGDIASLFGFTEGVLVKRGWNWTLNNEEEIADNEPDGRYNWRLYSYSGVDVQAYWSAADNAYIIPDGNTQQFIVSPNAPNGYFDSTFSLSVSGDQRGVGTADTISMDTTSVTLNNETIEFDKGVLTKIEVRGGGGNNTITLYGTADNVKTIVYGGSGPDTLDVRHTGVNAPVTFIGGTGEATVWVRATQSAVTVSGQSGLDSVVVGYQGDGQPGSLASVRAAVNVSNVSNLTIDDSADAKAHAVTVSDARVSGLGADVNYSRVGSGLTIKGAAGGSTYDVLATAARSTSILGGSGDDTFYVRTTKAPLSVDGGGGGGYDRVTIGYRGVNQPGSMKGIAGAVTVSNVSLLTIDSSGDPYAQYVDDHKHVTGPYSAPVYYSGVSSVRILTGH
jgi:hypothetical protein